MREKINYYQCIYQCDVAYVGIEHRREKLVNLYERQNKDHVLRFYPEDIYKNRPGDILGLRDGRELQWYFLEVREKQVSRPKIDERGVPMSHKREDKPKFTKIKFVKLDVEDITDAIRLRAKILPMREMDLKPLEAPKVDRPTPPSKPKAYKRKRSNAKKVGAKAQVAG